MQVIEQLDGYHFDERWLVEVDGAPRVIWALSHHHAPWFAETAALTQPLRGPIHPRLATLYSAVARERMLLLETDDDRGPTLGEAAEQLEPTERERWVVSQIIAICDGLAALRARHPNVIYTPLYPERIFVDVAGHARLRAPMVSASAPQTSRTGGGDMNAIAYLSPELLTRKAATQASPVFSLAINLCLAATGTHPFGETSGMPAVSRIMQGQREPLAVQTPGLARVIDRALVGEPADRLPDPATFATELRACLPDAADYDAVISDRIVPWRASLRKPEAWGIGLLTREQLEAL
jgi:hypothetical protein